MGGVKEGGRGERVEEDTPKLVATVSSETQRKTRPVTVSPAQYCVLSTRTPHWTDAFPPFEVSQHPLCVLKGDDIIKATR